MKSIERQILLVTLSKRAIAADRRQRRVLPERHGPVSDSPSWQAQKRFAMETTRHTISQQGPFIRRVVVVSAILLLAVLFFRFRTPVHSQENDSSPVDSSPSNAAISAPEDSALIVATAPSLFVDTSAEGAPAPYSDESMADDFAIGVVRQVVERGGSNYLPIRLKEVFIGRLPSGRFLAEDSMVVRMECSLPPRNLGLRSQLYTSGTKVVVYLSQDDAQHWVVNSIVPMSPGSETYWHDRLQMFADIVLAGESEDPEQRFRELLTMLPDGGLSHYIPIAMFPHPAARPVIRDLWRKRVQQHPIDPEQSDMIGTMSLTYLLRNLDDNGMLDEILEHGLRQAPGRRGVYIHELRVQSDAAGAVVRGRLADRLQKFLDDAPELESLDPVSDLKMWGDVSNAIQTLKDLRTPLNR